MKTLVTIKLVEADDGTRDVVIDAPSDLPAAEPLDLVIAKLARMRSTVQPPFGEFSPTIGGELELIADPRVYAHVDFDGNPVLTFRHPGLGFLSFALMPASADYILRHLTHTQQQSGAPGTVQ